MGAACAVRDAVSGWLAWLDPFPRRRVWLVNHRCPCATCITYSHSRPGSRCFGERAACRRHLPRRSLDGCFARCWGVNGSLWDCPRPRSTRGSTHLLLHALTWAWVWVWSVSALGVLAVCWPPVTMARHISALVVVLLATGVHVAVALNTGTSIARITAYVYCGV